MQQVRESVKVLFPISKGKSDYDDFLVISMLEQMLDAAKPYASYSQMNKRFHPILRLLKPFGQIDQVLIIVY